ncbi:MULTISPECIES: GNAT family N-acetyltransferase [unclassified Ekhidna]|jgi:predicted GNAT family acetyltransferase|uniref:GNAT family N-acetyltransferase n=1 Tax=unclassified Ekhidna TaxID=2632188 RepID=UPI0032DFE739
MDLASLKTENNTEEQRFMLQLHDSVAFIDYKIGKSGAVYLIHTEVPDEMEGQGVGHKLVRESLEIIEKDDLKIIPLCPFVKSFIQNHLSDYEHLLAEGAKL